ncbi:MAG: FecR domain-containing protein [Planctomycetota bacterium]
MTPNEKQRIRELASTVMDGTCGEDQRRELNQILRGNDAARDEYLAALDLHAVLMTDLSVGSSTDTAPVPPVTPKSHSREPSSHRWVRVGAIAALAAGLLLFVSLIGNAPSESPSFVTIAQLNNAVWQSDRFDVGNRFGATTMRLESGLVRLEYDSGVELTLEGPAELTLISAEQAELSGGLLTATVPPGAEGFSVDTPTAKVVDLGTSFGIDLREDGFSNVAVFDGEVEVAIPDSEEKRLLTEGESVRIGRDSAIEDVGFDPEPFGRLWPIASGIVASTENIQFVPPWPKQIRFIESDDYIFTAPEGHSIRLATPLKLTIAEPGEYSQNDDLSPGEVPEGSYVRSFIFHYSPVEQTGPRRAARILGSVTFDRPVLGLITRHEDLVESRRFSRRGAGEANPRRELRFTGGPDGDRVLLSEDRKTLTLDLVSPGRSSDLMRVIVEGTSRRRPPKKRRRDSFETLNENNG